MKRLECPHCHQSRLSSAKFPSNMAAIMQCPSCGQLVVTFRGKTVGLDRSLLESGEKEERKQHLASVIAEFLDPELLDLNFDDFEMGIGFGASSVEGPPEGFDDETEGGQDLPISDAELRSFTRDELSKLDDTDYFRRHFS